MVKLHALSITRWKHADASIKEPVHLSFAIDLSQLVRACERHCVLCKSNAQLCISPSC